MKKQPFFISCILLLLSHCLLSAQEFIPLWENATMPNSRGIPVADTIANERISQVGTPGMYVFQPSAAENKQVSVLIIPGGGYVRLAYQISGFQLAKWFNTFGVTAFVLNHRLPHSPDLTENYKAPLQDAQRAIRYIRAHAATWGIDPEKTGVMGSSAGGHLSACLSTLQEDWSKAGDSADLYSFLPDFTILISPVVTMSNQAYVHTGSRDNLLREQISEELVQLFSCEEQVNSTTPPAFIVHAANDPAVSCMNSVLYFTALQKNKVAGSALHIYPEGEHTIALRNNPGTTNSWPQLAEQWLNEIGILN